MIDAGSFYVITLGRRYVRTVSGMVTQQLEHAEHFSTRGPAVEAAKLIRADAEKNASAQSKLTGRKVHPKRVTVQRITVQVIE